MTVDPFLLRGASLGAAWRADRGGAAGAVYHTAGAGPLPIASGLPIVATLLDLAPWELPEAFGRTAARAVRAAPARPAAARGGRGHRRRTGGDDRAPRRLLHLRPDRIRVVPLAPAGGVRPGDRAPGADRPPRPTTPRTAERERLGLTGRYLVYSGRYDARQDLAHAPPGARVAGRGRPARRTCPTTSPGRRGSCCVGASPDDRASLARAAARQGIGECLAYAPAAGHARRRPDSSAAPGRPSCPSCPRRPAWPRSRRSPAGRRSSPRRSGHPARDRRGRRGPRRAARPGPAGRRPCARSGPTTASTGAWPRRRSAARPRVAGRGPTWPPRRGPSTRRSGAGPH